MALYGPAFYNGITPQESIYNTLASQGAVAGPVNPQTQLPQPTGGSVLGASTSSGGGGGGGAAPTGGGGVNTSTYVDNAKSGNQSMLDAIQARLNETRRLAGKTIDNAAGARDHVLEFINQRYPELQNRVEQQRSNTLADLGTQETGLQTLYDKANAQSRRRSEDVALQNRMSARAGNRLGSSFYDQSVQSNQENLGRTLGASDLERIGKIAAIGTQKTRANQDYNNTLNDLDTQKNQATYSAYDEYKKAVQQAEALDKAGVLDFGEGQAQAAQNLQSRLDQINQWAQGITQQQQAIQTQYAPGGGFDTTLGGIAANNGQFITSNAPTPAGDALGAYAPAAFTTPDQTNPLNYLGFGNQKPLTIEDILRGTSGGLNLGTN